LGVDRLTNLELFVRVAEAGGFTAVSRERALSQSSVSRKISELERWLGVQLLQRTTREVKLTEASQQLYQRSLALLSQVEDIESVIANSGTKTSGTLRLQASYEFGHAYVVPYVLDFMAEYPDINVDLRLNNRYVNLIEDGVDIAIRMGNLTDQNIVAKKLCRDRRHVVASPAYLQQRGVPRTPEDLKNHDCVVYSFLENPNQWKFLSAEGTQEVTVSGRFRANGVVPLHAAVLAGHGIAILGNFMVHKDLESGRLRKILPDFHVQPIDIQIIYVPTRHLPRKVRTFIDFYATRLKQSELFQPLSEIQIAS
jgi:DNA-binding transcriptional LysR family regulator